MRLCKNCDYWYDLDEDENFGECRRYPPKAEVSDKSPHSRSFNFGKDEKIFYDTSQFYIHTRCWDYCGEWSERLEYDRSD
tara:strand:+ start:276 stop:515 length:240 start_codon:yes stop_codon:yes gene_type:complete